MQISLSKLVDNSEGVSPVIGVILMVAIVVILAAVIGVFVLDLAGSNQKPAQASVTFDENPDKGLTVRFTENVNADSISIRVNSSKKATLNSVGDSATVAVKKGDSVSVVGVNNGKKTVLQTYNATQKLGSTVPPNISGTVSYNPPAQGVIVKALDSDGNVVGQDKTDASGSFSVPGTGNYTVNGYTVTEKISEGEDIEIDTKTSGSNPIADKLMEGDGSKDNPYKVDSASDIYAMNSDLDAHYVLMTDIDVSKAVSSWKSVDQWRTIGSASNPFTGSFNGNNHTLSNVNVANNASYRGQVGFFAELNNATVKNVTISSADMYGKNNKVGIVAAKATDTTIKNVSTSGTIKSNQAIGGLVGIANGTTKIVRSDSSANITAKYGPSGGLVGKFNSDNSSTINIKNSTSSVNISGQDSNSAGSKSGGLVGAATNGLVIHNSSSSADISSKSRSGGLVGQLDGGNSSRVNIYKSSFSGVLSDGTNSGGLVGYAKNKVIISNSYSDADINGEGGIGGLVGSMDNSTIKKSYSESSVGGKSSTGGLVGKMNGSSSSISNSYTTSNLTNRGNAVIGYKGAGTVSDVYYNADNASGSNGTGLTTSKMKGSSASSNMTGLDFSSVWTTVSGNYPELQNNREK